MSTKLIAGITAMALASCTVGPDYQKSTDEAQTAWSSRTMDGLTDSSAAASSWWTSFNDGELNSLVQRAIKANLDLRVSEARLRQARAVRGMSVADFGPTVDTTASAARQLQSKNQPLIGSLPLPANFPFEYDVYNAGFDASWEIDLFGGKRRALEAATAEWQGATEARNDVMLSLLAELARNYVELRGGQRRREIAVRDSSLQAEAVSLTRARFQSGVTNELDVTRAAALLAGTEAAVPPLDTAVRKSMYAIAVLLDRHPGELVAELSPALPVPPVPPEIPIGLPSDLLRRRPDVRQAERQLAAETARIGVAEAEWFPKFSLTGDVGVESVNATKWFVPGSLFWSVGPSVQWRIFDFGRVRAEVQAQTAVQEAALATYEKVALIALQEAENAVMAYAREQNRHAALVVEVEQNRRSLAMADALYTKGRVNYLDVLDARRSLYQSDDELAVSDQAISVDLVTLYKALGGGWETLMTQTASP
jgi:multidrug efflux system outer membrane protein